MFHLILSAICAWFAFLLPTFATYKALQQRPLVQDELEKIGKYWSVIGALVAVEYTAEWLVSWLPFYWELKTVFLLFLSLPQTDGSTYVYNAYLKPFFVKNEKTIDSGIISFQASIISFFQSRLAAIWDLLWSVINKQPPVGQPPAPASGQPGAPVGGMSIGTVMGMWRTYGPALVSALQQGRAAPNDGATVTPSASSTSVDVPTAQPKAAQTFEQEAPAPSVAEPEPIQA